MNREQLSGLAAVSPSASQGNGLESHFRTAPPGAGGAWTPLEAGRTRHVFQRRRDRETKRTSRWKQRALPAGRRTASASASFPHVWAQEAPPGLSQRLQRQPTQLGATALLSPQSAGSPYEKAASKVATGMCVGGHVPPCRAQYENVENLEFVQNQEVLPSEPPQHGSFLPRRSAQVCGPFLAQLAPGSVRWALGGGGLESRGPDIIARLHGLTACRPVTAARATGAFQVPGSATRVPSFNRKWENLRMSLQGGFKQIDSSPVGGETD